MFKNLQKNLGSTVLNPGIKFSTLAIAVATLCASSAFAQDATITTTGTTTNTVPAGQNSVTIELWGAGGTGGNSFRTVENGGTNYEGSGGGGGGYSSISINVTVNDTYNVFVGTNGGSRGAAGGDGFPGETSTVTGTNLTGFQAAGGTGGIGSGSAGGVKTGSAGGSGSGGDTNLTGASGGDTSNGTSGAGGNGAGPGGGAGGAAVTYVDTNIAGNVGLAPGGGGSGAAGSDASFLTGNKSGQRGGLGGDGQAKFTYSTTVLPVSLISFNASASNNQAKLSWSTASEARNDRFEVQRSSDNVTYVTVATVKGNGTTSQKSSYTAYDANPENGVNYYKLVQIDNDGTTKELAIKSVSFSFALAAAVNVYPNPASGVLNVNINSKTAQKANATLTGSNGKVYLTKTLQLIAGANTASVNLSGNIAPGQYILTVAGVTLQESVKVMVK